MLVTGVATNSPQSVLKIELIWVSRVSEINKLSLDLGQMQRWSHMTILYLGVRRSHYWHQASYTDILGALRWNTDFCVRFARLST
jgi:hypothetical protein